MPKTNGLFSKGRNIVLLFLPAYIVVFHFTAWLQERSPVLTNNGVALMGAGMIVVLLLGLSFLFHGVRHVPAQRFYAMDKFLCVLLVVLMLVSMRDMTTQIWNLVRMAFDRSTESAYLHQHYGYLRVMDFAARFGLMTAGAGLWLYGVSRKRSRSAIAGAVLFTILLVQGGSGFFPGRYVTPRRATPGISETRGSLGVEGDAADENHPMEITKMRIDLGSAKASIYLRGIHGPGQFYFLVLLLITIIRFGGRAEGKVKMACAVLLLLYLPVSAVAGETYSPPDPPMEAHVPIRALTAGPHAHWFAYYDKHQFDTSDRYILGMQVGFEDRAPEPDDAIVLGMIDTEEGDRWIPFAESTAWCWQQGCMLQWLPGSDTEVIYNARNEDGYISVIQDVFTGEKRTLPRPVYTVSPDGRTAVTLNFARVGETRPGYGYNGIPDQGSAALHPENDGIYFLDLVTGESRLVITLAAMAAWEPDDTMDKGKHWFNHLLFNPDGSRFIFLHRWHRPDGVGRFTRGFTARPDGQDILTADGHCTYSPCGEWILTDTYPDRDRMQTLILYRVADGKRVDLGRFYQEQPSDIQLRCDLHPRWSRDGNRVCIDSRWSGQRQMYLLDVSEVLAGVD